MILCTSYQLLYMYENLFQIVLPVFICFCCAESTFVIPLFPPLAYDVPVKGVKEGEQEEDAGNYSNQSNLITTCHFLAACI